MDIEDIKTLKMIVKNLTDKDGDAEIGLTTDQYEHKIGYIVILLNQIIAKYANVKEKS